MEVNKVFTRQSKLVIRTCCSAEVFLYDGGSHYNNGLDGQSEEFKGRVSHFPDELKDGNASIIIRNTTLVDSGDYTCYFPNLQPPQTFYIDLVKPRTDPDSCGEWWHNSHNKDSETVITMVVVVVHVIVGYSRALRGVVWHSSLGGCSWTRQDAVAHCGESQSVAGCSKSIASAAPRTPV
uniref:Immunoglobulin-like beta-sandwich domain-containing protein n=1 Tax=Sander lucioperca TaxID=283035 RepID=A0A8C9Y4P4_SANLU